MSSAGASSASIIPLGNGWYLCTTNFTAALMGTFAAVFDLRLSNGGRTYSGDGVSGAYVYGAQIEP